VIGFSLIVQSDTVTKATHGKLMKKLNRTVMIRHAIRRLPGHFESIPATTPGSGGYRYKRRTNKTIREKERDYGHTKPNVLTGKLRQAVLSRVRVTATQHKGTLKTRGTAEHPLAGFQQREIEARTLREVKEDVKWQEKEYARLAQTEKYRRKRRRKVG